MCLNWTKLHAELACLEEIFLKFGYPENYVNKYFQRLMDNIHLVKEITLTFEKKPPVLVLAYLGSMSSQTRIKLKKSLKNILNYCCKLQIVLKNKTRLGNNFHLKDWIPKYLICPL